MGRKTNAEKFNISADNDLAPFMTKAGNYLLWSARGSDQRRILALVHAGRVHKRGLPSIIKGDLKWAGHCAWNIKLLEKHGFVHLDRYEYKITRAGALALEAALIYLGEVIDTEALLAEIDAIEVL